MFRKFPCATTRHGKLGDYAKSITFSSGSVTFDVNEVIFAFNGRFWLDRTGVLHVSPALRRRFSQGYGVSRCSPGGIRMTVDVPSMLRLSIDQRIPIGLAPGGSSACEQFDTRLLLTGV